MVDREVSAERGEVARRMYEEYVIRDAGGQAPPMYG
jgi:hypothetical protein